jgi:hypothetical protein
MFFKKRRDAKKAAEADARQQVIKDLQERFDTAMNCTDPAEKFMKLEEIREMVDAATSTLKGNAVKKAGENGQFTFLGTMSAGTASAWIVAGLHFPPLLGMIGIIGGIYGGIFAGKKMVLHSHQKQMEKNQPFIDALEAEKTKAVAAADETLDKRLRDMASSPKFGELIDKVPRVREQFTKAYGRKIAEEDAIDRSNPRPKNPPNDNGFRL